jgi:hypothetical protein
MKPDLRAAGGFLRSMESKATILRNSVLATNGCLSLRLSSVHAMSIVVWGINYAPEKIGIAPCNVAFVRVSRSGRVRCHDVDRVCLLSRMEKEEGKRF